MDKAKELGSLTVVGIEDYKNNSSRIRLTCSIHGNCWEFGNPFTPTLDKALHEVSSCPKCSKKYRRTEKETLDLLKGKEQGRYQVVSIDNYKGVNSKVNVECNKCGPGWQFSPKPWKPTVETLLNGSSCSKCSGNYKRDYKEIWLEIASTLPKELTLVDIIDYQNVHSALMLRCDVHGNCWEWENDWTPSISKVRSIKGCLKCNGQYQRTERELLEKLNNVCSEKLTVVGFKRFSGNTSLCLVECDEHGPGWLFGNEYLPLPYNLEKEHSCPKCSGHYNPTIAELIQEIEILGKNRYRLLEPPTSTYAHSRVTVRCIHDNTPWSPQVTQLRIGQGCPTCGRSLSDLSEVYNNKTLQTINRKVYWLHLQTSQGTNFWKIGVTKNAMTTRFPRSNLSKDGVKLIKEEYLETTNLLALLTEACVIRMFSSHLENMEDTLKFTGGGTECFSSNAIGDVGLEAILADVIDRQADILKSFGLN